MSDPAPTHSRSLINIAGGTFAAVILAIVVWQTRPLWWPTPKAKKAVASEESEESPSPATEGRCVQLARGTTDTLEVAPATVNSMHLTSALVAPANHPDQLRLTGQLTLDPARLVHVHSRFAGEVIRMGTFTVGTTARPIRVGDRVTKGQTLAVLWSKEVGEKKSDLVDALSRLAMHQALFRNLKSLESSGAVPQRSISEMQRNYEQDMIEIERLRRTLRSWRLDESDLTEIEAEAKRIHTQASASAEAPAPSKAPAGNSHPLDAAKWAEFEIKAPFDGVILEQNLTTGDIVGTDVDIFKIADVSRLHITANIYEDELPDLLRLPEDQRRWSVRLLADPNGPATEGDIHTIGCVIDPSQHTAIVQGAIDNPDGRLRVGQFVEATINLPSPTQLAEIPVQAVIDDGPKKYVFVADDESLTRLQRREANIVRRTSKAVYVAADSDRGLRSGERVLTSGVIELSLVLDNQAAVSR
jgi:cobalt-zinc-cadmium efflux system membrane fusion protein